MTEYYDDPYSFNYATQIKGPNTSSSSSAEKNKNTNTPPTKNVNVFNPNRVQKEKNAFNEDNTNQNLNRGQDYNNNNNFDGLQGNIDLDKNVVDEKTKEYRNDTYDFEEELPLLEGKIK